MDVYIVVKYMAQNVLFDGLCRNMSSITMDIDVMVLQRDPLSVRLPLMGSSAYMTGMFKVLCPLALFHVPRYR